MTAAVAKPASRKLWKFVLSVAAVGILFLLCLSWYATTKAFQDMVRGRLVSELERITGGRVEVGSVHTVPFRFQVEVRDLTIHGLELKTEIPYAHIDHLIAQLKITSALSFGLAFRSVVIEHPTIHLISYPDGTTNQPRPKLASTSGGTPIENLSLSINELEVRSGELIWNDEKLPLDFTAKNVFADMSYSLLHNRYESSILFGKAMMRYKTFPSVAWTASARFRLSENGIDLHSLEMTSGRSHLKASGNMVNFSRPSISADYDASIDVEEMGAITGVPDARGGILEFSGKGAWAAGNVSSVGKLQGRNVIWRDGSVNLRGADFSSGFSIDSKRILLPDIAGKILGGWVAGSMAVADWQNIKTSSGKGVRPTPQESTFHLRLKDISAFEVANAISTPARPFAKMNVAGSLSGSVEGRWKGSPDNLVAEVVLDMAEPASLKAGQLAIKGHTRTTYRRATEELEVAEFTGGTKATQVQASGTLSNSAAVKLSVTTSNLGEWQPLLIAAGYDQPIPVKLLGPASFNGTATGRLSSITFAGRLESGNFDFFIPETSRTAEEDVHWDSLVTDLRVSPAGLAFRNSMLRREDTAIAFDVNLGLENRHFTPDSPFTARVNMKHGNLEELLDMAGYDFPASGKLDLSVLVSGTRSDPEGSGTIHLSDAAVHGQPVQQLNSEMTFTKGEVALHKLELSQGLARVRGDASYTIATRTYTVNLAGDHFDLSRIPALRVAYVSVQGQLDFVARGSGTIESPTIDAKIHLRDLTLDQELAGDFTLNAVTQGKLLQVSGASQFKSADLKLEGNVQPSGDWPSTLDLQFAHLDVDSILKTYLRDHVTGHSAVAGNLHVEGPLRRPSELSLSGNLTDLYAEIQGVKLRNDGPVRFAIANKIFKVDHIHFIGDDTDIAADGTVNLTGAREIDFRAKGRLNLQLIQTYNSDLTSSGVLQVDMTVAGTMANPLAQGHMQIRNGYLAYTDAPSGLSDIDGTLSFNQSRFDIENLNAHVGGGAVAFRGHANLSNGQLLFDLGVHGEGVRLRYPPGVSSTANLDLQFVGSSNASTLTGDVTITKLAVTPGFDFGAYLQRTAQSAAISQTNSTLNRIRLDVHIVTLPELQMQTAVIRLSGSADLHLRGTAAKSVLLGRADVLEGQASFNGTKYRLERGDVTFANPVTTVPTVDLQASTQVRDYDITLNLNGPADKLNLTYRSEPPLPTADIIALLAFGQTTQQSTQLQQNGASSFNQDASNAILAAALNATISNRAQKLFGVSRIKIDPQGLNNETSPTQSGPAITIEQQVASNFTLSYSTNVSQTSQQVIQGEYNLTRNISVVGIRDQNGVVSFDVRIRQRKR